MQDFYKAITGEQGYLNLLQMVLDHGVVKGDRTGTGTLSVVGAQLRFNLKDGFPLLTTKKVHFKSVIHELLWFLSGDTKVGYLQENNVRIWNEWATEEQTKKFGREEGDLGPIYGHQWRNFGATKNEDGSYKSDGVDQIQAVIDEIKVNPNSRRLIVSGWNPAEINDVALPPCHTLFQFFVTDGKLSCQLTQRSGDMLLGFSFNLANYCLLIHMVAQVCDLEVGEFIWSGGDCHIYSNHIEQVKEQLSRSLYQMPTIELNKDIKNIFDFRFDDIKICNYESHPAIKAPVAV